MSTPSRLAIVADDLTGLQAISAEFGKLGIRVRTVLSCEDFELEESDEIIGVDTNSRHLDATMAATVVASVVTRLRRMGVRHVYKQADSGMQGQLAAEIESAMHALGAPGALYAPSCPVLERVTRNGHQQDTQGLDVDIPALWKAQTGHDLSQAEAMQWDKLDQDTPPKAWLINAETDTQLQHLARTVWPARDEDTATPWLLAGSVGFASALANMWRGRSTRTGAKPALVVAGSQQQQTRRQIEHLAKAVDGLILDISEIPLTQEEINRLAFVARASAQRGEHLIVLAMPSKSALLSKDGYPMLNQEARHNLNHNLLQLMAELCDESMPQLWSGVLVAGGGTSDLMARGVLLIKETVVTTWLAPGVAGSMAKTMDGLWLPFVTKAGTWGDTDVLIRSIEWIVQSNLQSNQ